MNSQNATDVLKALQNGDFGEKGRQEVDNFKAWCHKRMPYAVEFFSGQQVAAPANHNHATVDALTNHVSSMAVEDGTNWAHTI